MMEFDAADLACALEPYKGQTLPYSEMRAIAETYYAEHSLDVAEYFQKIGTPLTTGEYKEFSDTDFNGALCAIAAKKLIRPTTKGWKIGNIGAYLEVAAQAH